MELCDCLIPAHPSLKVFSDSHPNLGVVRNSITDVVGYKDPFDVIYINFLC